MMALLTGSLELGSAAICRKVMLANGFSFAAGSLFIEFMVLLLSSISETILELFRFANFACSFVLSFFFFFLKPVNYDA